MHKITQRSRPHTKKKFLLLESADIATTSILTTHSAVCHQISNDHIAILFFLIDGKNSQFANKDVWGKKLALLLCTCWKIEINAWSKSMVVYIVHTTYLSWPHNFEIPTVVAWASETFLTPPKINNILLQDE